jgi:succinoglycan biosynthesis transport protein ExoP
VSRKSSRLAVLAEIGGPASSNGRAWGLRRGDLEALDRVREELNGTRLVLVTGEEEATATVAVGLAGVAAAAGVATALVECDVERPRLADELGLEPTPGLHEYLRWEATPPDVVQPLVLAGSAAEGAPAPLACVTAGRRSDRSRALLDLGSFRHMTAKLGEAYELVVLLGPPLEGAGGPLGCAAATADCTVVALTEVPSKRAAKATHDALAWLQAPPLGAIVVTPTD